MFPAFLVIQSFINIHSVRAWLQTNKWKATLPIWHFWALYSHKLITAFLEVQTIGLKELSYS
jgi:hypothetical protein